jgi:menaquinone-dependent protoporphyrinogen oxidase
MGMSVLVAVASRHGSTEEIAEAIGIAIHGKGFRVDVVKLTDPAESGSKPDPAEYEAVVLGSGVYLGRWLAPAREFITMNDETLRAMPVWVFSSGPIGDHHAGDGEHAPVATLAATINPVGYRTFGGKLDRQGLGRVERVVVSLLKATDEDDRDWDDITSWACGIADVLQARAVPTS